MRRPERGAAGIRVLVGGDDVDVAGWCGPRLDANAVARRIEVELGTVRLEPGDLDGDFDYLSIWCGPTGLVEGQMLLRGRHRGVALRVLTTAATEFLAEGGLSDSSAPPVDE